MRVWIDDDEWYPCYSAMDTDHYGALEVDVDSDRYQWWLRAQDEWQEAQDDMRKAMRDDRPARS